MRTYSVEKLEELLKCHCNGLNALLKKLTTIKQIQSKWLTKFNLWVKLFKEYKNCRLISLCFTVTSNEINSHFITNFLASTDEFQWRHAYFHICNKKRRSRRFFFYFAITFCIIYSVHRIYFHPPICQLLSLLDNQRIAELAKHFKIKIDYN